MKKLIFAIVAVCSLAFAMDVGPDQTPRDKENASWTQTSKACEKSCSFIGLDGTRHYVKVIGTSQSCPNGSNATCTLKLCDALCN